MTAPFPVPDAAYDYATARAVEGALYGGGFYWAPVGATTPSVTLKRIPEPVDAPSLTSLLAPVTVEFDIPVSHALARLLARAFDVPLSLIAPWAVERPVVRARRLRVDRVMRARARRAARKGRVLR